MKLGSTPFKLLAGALFVLGAQFLTPATDANAATVAQYTFSSGIGSTPTLESVLDQGTSASTFNNGSGLTPVFSDRGFAAPSRGVTYNGNPSSNRGQALENNSYFSFTIAPDAGNMVKYDALFFQTDVGPSAAIGSYFVFADFQSQGDFMDITSTFNMSLDASSFVAFDPTGGSGGLVIGQAATGNRNFRTREFDLSGLNTGFYTRPLTFRIYQFDNATGTSGQVRLDNIQVEATVQPVPELPTSVLLMLGGAGFLLWRRKRGVAAPNSGRAPLAA